MVFLKMSVCPLCHILNPPTPPRATYKAVFLLLMSISAFELLFLCSCQADVPLFFSVVFSLPVSFLLSSIFLYYKIFLCISSCFFSGFWNSSWILCLMFVFLGICPAIVDYFLFAWFWQYTFIYRLRYFYTWAEW